MPNRYIIETKLGYVTTNKGRFTTDINSARIFKTEHAANSNRHLRKDMYNYPDPDNKVVPVSVNIERI